jgi:cell division transport system permease protein
MRSNFVMSGVAEGLRRNLLMSIALILTAAVSLSFVAAAILTGIEINRFRDQYREKLGVNLYLCDQIKETNCTQAITDPERVALEARLKTDPMIRSFTYFDKNAAYQIGLKTLDPAEAQFLQPGDLPASYTLKLKNPDKDYLPVFNEYSKVTGVQSVTDENDAIKTILQLFQSALLATIIVAAIVLISAIILIAITIQVAAAQRRTETSIMRLVGASRWMTQLPFIIEAVIAAAIGGLAALLVSWIGKWYVLDHVFSSAVKRNVLPDLQVNDVLIAGGISLIGGIAIAAVTAYVTLRLYVRL